MKYVQNSRKCSLRHLVCAKQNLVHFLLYKFTFTRYDAKLHLCSIETSCASCYDAVTDESERAGEGGAKQLKLIKENARMTRATLTGKTMNQRECEKER